MGWGVGGGGGMGGGVVWWKDSPMVTIGPLMLHKPTNKKENEI